MGEALKKSEHRAAELLAPAGDWEAMRSAVVNGADAIYFGLSNFNARHRATNFALESLPEVMEYLHAHNVRGYVAFNTLIFSDELCEAVKFIEACAAAGADALIVQDLGVARLIEAMTPTMEVHGSTQMTLTEARGIEFVRKLGVSRVILARELSTGEIERITAATTLPVEVFVHGALCVAYSGQCLTSESLGGRSANRGQCAQACRLPYELVVDGTQRDLGDKVYLLSPQDLAAHDLVPDLLRLGVASLKIEGRLKSAHYVAATTQTYRAALDSALRDQRFQISAQQQQDLAQSFSRGFTHGFLDGVDHQKLVHARFPKSRGIRIGTVEAVTGRGVMIRLDRGRSMADLKVQDGVVFDEGHPEQDEQGGRVMSVAPVRQSGDNIVEVTFHAGDVSLPAVARGAIVWKTDDPSVRKRLEHSFARDEVVHRLKLRVYAVARVGEALIVTARDGRHEAKVSWDGPLERAERFPLTVELLREQFSRLGNTPFELGEVKLECDNAMAPKSVLNDLRRQAVDELLRLRRDERRHRVVNLNALDTFRALRPNHPSRSLDPALAVLVRTSDQLRAVLGFESKSGLRPSLVYCDFEDIRRYAEAVAMAREVKMPIALATLRIVKPHEHGLLKQISDCNPDAVLVRNLAAVSYYSEERPDLAMLGDYSLNVANELTAQIFAEAGVKRLVPSYDLNWQQLRAMLSRSDPGLFEAVVHQHMPMFHMEHCVFCHTLSKGSSYRDCGRPCDVHRVELRDRVGQAHPLVADVGCRNTLFNAAAQSAAEYVPEMRGMGIGWFRVELLRESGDEAARLLERYARVLRGEDDGRQTWRQLRVLNQLGVTRGTLDYV